MAEQDRAAGGAPSARENAGTGTNTAQPPFRDVVLGSIAMILSVLGFTALDAINKILVESYSPFFLSWGRSIGQMLILLALAPLLGGFGSMLRTRRLGLHFARGLCIACVSLSVTFSISHLPLTQTYVIGFMTPFLATVIAAIALGERATWFQWTAITVGFTGVLVALQPTSPDASWHLLYPVAFAVANAVYFVLTRLAARTETKMAQLFYVGLFAGLVLSFTLPWHWETPTLLDWGLIGIAGLFGTCGHLGIVFAFSRAPTAVVSPMVYFQIVWSSIIGYLIFNDVPTVAVWIGASIVVAAGIALIKSQADQASRTRAKL